MILLPETMILFENRGKNMRYFRDKVSNTNRIFYLFGIGEFGYQMVAGYTVAMLSFFLTDVAMLSVTSTGVIIILSKIIKMIGAPVSGLLIDRQSFQGDRYIPWLNISALMRVVFYMLLFSLPLVIHNTSNLLALVVIVIIGATFSDSLFYSTYHAIYHRITRDPEKRAILSSSRSIAREAGEMMSGLSYPLLLTFFFAVGICNVAPYTLTFAVLSTLFLVFVCFFVRELKRCGGAGNVRKRRKKSSIKEISSGMIRNKALMIACGIMFLRCFRTFLGAPMKIYYYERVLGHFEYYSIDRLVSGIVGIAIIFLVPSIVKHMGTKKAYIISLLMAASCHALMFPFASSWKAYIVLYGISEAFVNIASVLTLNIFAMASDYGNWKNNTDYSGMNMSLYTFSLQSGIFACTILRTYLLNRVGYIGGDIEITHQIAETIISMLSVYPAVVLGLATILAIVFPINDEMYKKIVDDLERRDALN